MWVSQAGSCFLKQETVIVPRRERDFLEKHLWGHTGPCRTKHSKGTLCPLSEREQNSRYFSRYYATMRSWKHMEDGFFVLWHEIGKSTEHCMLSFYWQTLSTWETSVLFSCSQGNEGPHFQCSAHSAAFLWVAGVPEMNGRITLSVFSASCPQASLMAISEGLHLLTRSSSQQTDSSLLLCLDISGSACYLHLHTKAW